MIGLVHTVARATFAALVAVACIGVAGCGDDPEKRRVALVALIEAFGLEPQPDRVEILVSRVRDTNGYPYYVATGALDEPTREAGVARIEKAFERDGWEVFELGAVDYFLGACVRAHRGSMVANATIGWSTKAGFNPFPRLPGRVYVQTSVGHEDSNQAFTNRDFPICGA